MRAFLALATVSLLASPSAHALAVNFGGTPNATFGITSRYTNSSGVVSDSTIPFGATNATVAGECGTDTALEVIDADNGSGNNGSGLEVAPTTNQNGLHVGPSNGQGCYLYTTSRNGATDQASLTGYTDLFPINGDVTLDPSRIYYFGFLWGTPDSYNTFQLLGSDGLPMLSSFGGLDTNGNGILDGNEIYSQYGFSAATVNPGATAERYINLSFLTTDPIVFGVRVGSNGNCCTEIDNVTFSFTPATDPGPVIGGSPVGSPGFLARAAVAVPEPGAGIAMIAGLGLLGFARRRRV